MGMSGEVLIPVIEESLNIRKEELYGRRECRTAHYGTEKGLKNLGEALLLQSIEDLWNPAYREDSFAFFKGHGFEICSEITGIDCTQLNEIFRALVNKKTRIKNQDAGMPAAAIRDTRAGENKGAAGRSEGVRQKIGKSIKIGGRGAGLQV